MLDAWNLKSIEYFYLVCIVVGGLLFILRAILFAVGGGDSGGDASIDSGSDFDLDGDVDHVAEPGLKLVSMQGITGFFLMFGLVGMAMSRGGIQPTWTALGGVAAGLVTMLVTAKVFLEMQRLQSDGTLRMENAIGLVGRVYLTIPEEGSGKVSIAIQGGLRELEAVSATKERIPTGESVRVVSLIGNRILVVERVD